MSCIEGRIAKFRVSCDGCNESKVRCSQTKPQCRRCARQGIACVYGLSRRSHRTAPRVGASQTQTALERESFLSGDAGSSPFPLRGSSDTTGGGSSSGSSAEGGGAAQGRTGGGGTTEVASEVTTAFQEDEATATDRTLLTSSTDLMPNCDMYARRLTECGSLDLPTSFEPAFDPLHDLSTAISNLPGRFLPPQSSSCNVGVGSSRDSFFGSEVRDEPQRPASGPCSCNNLVVKQLLSLSFQSEEENGALDTQFAQLKHAISVSEECISCACTSRDEMSISTKRPSLFFPPHFSFPLTFLSPFISCHGTTSASPWLCFQRTICPLRNSDLCIAVTTSILIGRIIEGFEIFMTKANALSSPTRSNNLDGSDDSSPGVSVPRLSWGVLQIEPDEEAELKRHMWLIQLRKLQRVIKKLIVAVGQLRNAQDSGNSAHIMTCQYIHMWLVQKAEGLEDRYRVDDAAVIKECAARHRTGANMINPKDNMLEDQGYCLREYAIYLAP